MTDKEITFMVWFLQKFRREYDKYNEKDELIKEAFFAGYDMGNKNEERRW